MNIQLSAVTQYMSQYVVQSTFITRYASTGIGSIIKCLKSAFPILIVIVFTATGALAQRPSPISGRYVNDVLVARCQTGDLHVVETVDTNTGARGGVYAWFGFSFVNERDKTPKSIGVTLDGSYKRPTTSDRLAIFRSPQKSDLHIFVSPRLFDPVEYQQLVNCIAQNMANIYEKMAISRPLHNEFPSRDRILQPIATMRYSDVNDILKRYQCGADGKIDVSPGGHVELRRYRENGASYGALIGVMLDDGKTMGVVDPVPQDFAIASLPNYLGVCTTTAGTLLAKELNVQVLAKDSLLEAINLVSEQAMLIGSAPNTMVAPSKQ